jgi:hypothetical protein
MAEIQLAELVTHLVLDYQLFLEGATLQPFPVFLKIDIRIVSLALESRLRQNELARQLTRNLSGYSS